MAFDQTTLDAARRLAASLAGKPWYGSVGVVGEAPGRAALVVYLKRRLRNRENTPTEWEGIPVRTEHIGRVEPAASG